MATAQIRKPSKASAAQATKSDIERISQQIEKFVNDVQHSFKSLIAVVREAHIRKIPLGKWEVNPWVEIAMKVVINNLPEKLADRLLGCSPTVRRAVVNLGSEEKKILADTNCLVSIARKGDNGKYIPETVPLFKVPDHVVSRLFAGNRIVNFIDQVKMLEKRKAAKRTSKKKDEDPSYDLRVSSKKNRIEVFTISTGRVIIELDANKLVLMISKLDPVVATKIVNSLTTNRLKRRAA